MASDFEGRLDSRLRSRREEAIRRLVECEARGEPPPPDVFPSPRYELIGLNKVYEGRDQVASWLAERKSVFPDQHTELIELHHAEDAVVAEFWYSGTHLGSLGDIEPSGRAFRCRMAAIFLFDEDVLTCARIYFDLGTIARQLA
ncbi:MAG: hypothetical protein KatS3mg008_0286 [Acidimicrobiales bacterium]|nr:MAG: hypothetical protein KatS3mg008_0286 [Acidimicrobiales bacterium]